MNQNLGTCLGPQVPKVIVAQWMFSTKIDGIFKTLTHRIGILGPVGVWILQALLGSPACTQGGQIDGFVLHELQELLESKGRLVGRGGKPRDSFDESNFLSAKKLPRKQTC